MKEIELTQGKVALVDDEDYEYLSQWNWYYDGGYARRAVYNPSTQKTKGIFMHMILMNPPSGLEVDHKDRNGLNNQKYNLRICTHSQNVKNVGKQKRNTSGYRGVYWYKRNNAWGAILTVNSKRIFLGLYATAKDAAIARDVAAIRYHGEFACLNFPEL